MYIYIYIYAGGQRRGYCTSTIKLAALFFDMTMLKLAHQDSQGLTRSILGKTQHPICCGFQCSTSNEEIVRVSLVVEKSSR